jgi:EAL domain-containing protein (putative c-di-GMP-specific phosphodiesterase class I)
LIVPIGAWVLDEALDQLCRFDDEAGGAGRAVDMAVNVSPRQLRDPAFVETVRRALQRTGVAAHRLQLEITESVLLGDTRENLAALRELRELGVRLVLDDFGTGYSSLGYLKRFPLDVVKIDRSFVAGLPHRRDDVAIVTAVLAFAEALALDVVAEGIETDEHRRALRRMGCSYGQGFFFSRPLPAAEISALLAGPRIVGVSSPA